MTRPGDDEDLHGNAPDKSHTVLLLLDVLNDLSFEGGEHMLPRALRMAEAVKNLREQADARGIPVVYANDNFGKWRSDMREIVRHCLHDGVPGEPLVKRLAPRPRDYVLLKPKHSAFLATPLELLLNHLKARRLILAGLTGDMCVHFTANDAYLRGFALHVPADCVASLTPDSNHRALATMHEVLGADIAPAGKVFADEGRFDKPGKAQ